MFYWIPATDIAISTQHKMVSPDSTVPLSPANLPPLESPKLTMFDLFYCFHGEIMNLVIMSQLIYGRTLWKFADDRYRRMKPLYFKIWTFSVFLFLIITFQFLWDNKVEQHWDNARTLQYCNKLFILKITMSLIKYIPQVKHNRDRKSVKGFSISGVMLDITGGVASVLQLLWQLGHAEDGFTWMVLVLNFGKIGLSMVTLTFCSVFIGQWLAYGDV